MQAFVFAKSTALEKIFLLANILQVIIIIRIGTAEQKTLQRKIKISLTLYDIIKEFDAGTQV